MPAGTPARRVLDRHREEVLAIGDVVTGVALGAAPARWPGDLLGDRRLRDVRSVLLHVTTETACHAGHLDVVRELVDGRQRLVPG